MRASAARQIRRTTAELELADFMDRVPLINKDSAYLYSITKVVLFGSALRSDERLGDVDVAIDLESRIPLKGNWVELFRQHAWSSGHTFRTFDEEIDWPPREVILALKARKRSISIHSWFAFIEMEKPPSFEYKVLLGNTSQIRGELVRSEKDCRKGCPIEPCSLPN
jgi:predicted nucleotidyltransferase